jgi:hypothetical protein
MTNDYFLTKYAHFIPAKPVQWKGILVINMDREHARNLFSLNNATVTWRDQICCHIWLPVQCLRAFAEEITGFVEESVMWQALEAQIIPCPTWHDLLHTQLVRHVGCTWLPFLRGNMDHTMLWIGFIPSILSVYNWVFLIFLLLFLGLLVL